MKMKTAIGVAALGVACAMSTAFATEPSQAALMSQAKVSQEQAKSTALARIPSGVVKSAELEKERGKLVWSFDISQPSVKGLTEIQVDAITGNIVSLKAETPAQEAKELKAEAKESRDSKKAVSR